VPKSNSVIVKVSVEGRKVTSVPLRSPGSRSRDGFQRRFGIAMRKRIAHSLPWRLIFRSSVFGERIDDRNADAVQTAGNLIGILVELTARVQLGHDDFRGGYAFFL
jgi:hypothetical protein